MDKEVVWSLEASNDLESLADYISRDSIFYAEAFVREILLASRSLSFMASRGRIVPELDVPHIRELMVNEYRLLYHIEESRIVILGCIHGKRHLKKLWQKGKKRRTRLQ